MEGLSEPPGSKGSLAVPVTDMGAAEEPRAAPDAQPAVAADGGMRRRLVVVPESAAETVHAAVFGASGAEGAFVTSGFGPSNLTGGLGVSSPERGFRGSASGLSSCPNCDAECMRALVEGPFYLLMAMSGLHKALPTEYDEDLDQSGRVSIHPSEGGNVTATVRELDSISRVARCETHQLKHLSRVSAGFGSQHSMNVSVTSGIDDRGGCRGRFSSFQWSCHGAMIQLGKRAGVLAFTIASVVMIIGSLFPAFDSHYNAEDEHVPTAWTLGPRLAFVGPPFAYYWVLFKGRNAVRILVPLIRSEEAREHVRGRTRWIAGLAYMFALVALASWISDELAINQQGEGRSTFLAVCEGILFVQFLIGACAPVVYVLLFMATLSWRAKFLIRPLELRMVVSVEQHTFENQRHYGRKRIRSVASEDQAVASSVLAGGESVTVPGTVPADAELRESKDSPAASGGMVRVSSFTGDVAFDEEVNGAARAFGAGDAAVGHGRLVGAMPDVPEGAAVAVDMSQIAGLDATSADEAAPVILARLLGALKLRAVLQKTTDAIAPLTFFMVALYAALGLVCTFAGTLVFLTAGRNAYMEFNLGWGFMMFTIFFVIIVAAGNTSSHTFRVVPRLLNMASDNPTARSIMRANFDITNRAMQMRDRDVFTVVGVSITPAFVLRLAYLYCSFYVLVGQLLFGGVLPSSTTPQATVNVG